MIPQAPGGRFAVRAVDQPGYDSDGQGRHTDRAVRTDTVCVHSSQVTTSTWSFIRRCRCAEIRGEGLACTPANAETSLASRSDSLPAQKFSLSSGHNWLTRPETCRDCARCHHIRHRSSRF
jgi:hypothetical protein